MHTHVLTVCFFFMFASQDHAPILNSIAMLQTFSQLALNQRARTAVCLLLILAGLDLWYF